LYDESCVQIETRVSQKDPNAENTVQHGNDKQNSSNGYNIITTIIKK